MSDPFTLLELPRRPWLEESAIRAAFQDRARRIHPDAAGGDAEAFASLNAAQAALANPAARLRLLVGEEGAAAAMPSDIALGFRVAGVMRTVGGLQEKDRTATNILTRALLTSEAAQVRKNLDEIIHALENAKAGLDARLQALDARWPDVSVAELSTLAGEYVYLTQWKEQTREGEVALRIVFGKGGGGI